MIALALVLLLASDEPKYVVVVKGETLAAIAQRELGDANAASELAAINNLPAGTEPKKKTKLLLPGPERVRATAAMRKAKATVSAAQAGASAGPGGSPDAIAAALALLNHAVAAQRAARYTEAESLAGAAERRLKGGTTRFSIVVEPKGKESRFIVQEGSLDVKAGGKTASAKGGQSVRTKGSAAAPKVLTAAPSAPELVEPVDGWVVADMTSELKWTAAKNARSYQLLVAKDLAFHDRVASLQVETTSLMLPPGLPKGVYYWKVSAVSATGSESAAAGPRVFEITREPKGDGIDWEWGPIWDPWGVKQ